MIKPHAVKQLFDLAILVHATTRAHRPVAVRMGRKVVYLYRSEGDAPSARAAAGAPDEPGHEKILKLRGSHRRLCACRERLRNRFGQVRSMAPSHPLRRYLDMVEQMLPESRQGGARTRADECHHREQDFADAHDMVGMGTH